MLAFHNRTEIITFSEKKKKIKKLTILNAINVIAIKQLNILKISLYLIISNRSIWYKLYRFNDIFF